MILNKLIEQLPIIPCQEATRLSSKAMESELSMKERWDLWLHLRVCEFCTQFVKQVHGLRALLRTYEPRGEKKLSQEAKDQIKTVIKNMG